MRESLEQAIERPPQPVKWGTIAHDHDLYAMLTDIAAQQRDLDAIRRYASKAQPLVERDNHQLYIAIIHRAMGVAHRLAGEFAESDARSLQALKIFESLGARWQFARTLAECGELELARNDHDAARDCFSRAQSEFEALHAEPDAGRIRAQSRG